LYGREVDRPAWLETRRKKGSVREAAEREEKIVELMKRKWSVRRIAGELGEKYGRVQYVVRKWKGREKAEGRGRKAEGRGAMMGSRKGR